MEKCIWDALGKDKDLLECVQGFETPLPHGTLRDLGLFTLEKRKLCGDFIVAFCGLKGK